MAGVQCQNFPKHGGKAVAGGDGLVLGGHDGGIAAGQGGEFGERPDGSGNVAVGNQTAGGDIRQHLGVGGAVDAAQDGQAVHERLKQGLGGGLRRPGRPEKHVEGMVEILGPLLMPDEDDPLFNSQTPGLRLALPALPIPPAACWAA